MNEAEGIAFDIRYHVTKLNEALAEAAASNLTVEIAAAGRSTIVFTTTTLIVSHISREEIL